MNKIALLAILSAIVFGVFIFTNEVKKYDKVIEIEENMGAVTMITGTKDSVRQKYLANTSITLKQPTQALAGDYYNTEDFKVEDKMFTRFERDQMADGLIKMNAFTTDFNSTVISDIDVLSALLTDYIQRCGDITLKNHTGQFPPPISEVLKIVKADC